jgi:hypothetical protein
VIGSNFVLLIYLPLWGMNYIPKSESLYLYNIYCTCKRPDEASNYDCAYVSINHVYYTHKIKFSYLSLSMLLMNTPKMKSEMKKKLNGGYEV